MAMASTGAWEPDAEPEPPVAVDEAAVTEPPLAVDEAAVRRQLCILNLENRMPIEHYVTLFGAPQDLCPWGDRLWSGMQELLGRYNKATWLLREAAVPLHVIIPATFSKENARRPCDPQLNASSGMRYPAFCWQMPGQETYYVACLHILYINCKPWQFHESWVVLHFGVRKPFRLDEDSD